MIFYTHKFDTRRSRPDSLIEPVGRRPHFGLLCREISFPLQAAIGPVRWLRDWVHRHRTITIHYDVAALRCNDISEIARPYWRLQDDAGVGQGCFGIHYERQACLRRLGPSRVWYGTQWKDMKHDTTPECGSSSEYSHVDDVW